MRWMELIAFKQIHNIICGLNPSACSERPIPIFVNDRGRSQIHKFRRSLVRYTVNTRNTMHRLFRKQSSLHMMTPLHYLADNTKGAGKIFTANKPNTKR